MPATPNITWDSIDPFESLRPKIKESIITSIQMRAPAVLSIDCSNATDLSEGEEPFLHEQDTCHTMYPTYCHILGTVAASPFDLPAGEGD